MTSTIVFDLDGTLLDCRPRQVELAARLLYERSEVALDREEFWRLKRNGASTRDAVEALYRDAKLATEIAESWLAKVEQPDWLALDQPLPGIEHLLTSLAASAVRCELLTARVSSSGVFTTLRRLRWHDLFAGITVVDPRSAAQEKAAFLSRMRPLAFIGDTESDMKAARLAGCQFLAVSSGQRAATWLEAHGAAKCYEDARAAVTVLQAQFPIEDSERNT